MLGRVLGASAEREGRALVEEVLRVREASFVLALHIIPLYISLSESLWIARALVGVEAHPASASTTRNQRGRESLFDRQEENGEIDGSAGEAVLGDTQQR